MPAGTILIFADSASIAAGTTTQLHAIDSSRFAASVDATATVTWSSSDPSIATVSASGLLTGVSAGNIVISAKVKRDSGSIPMTIDAAAVTGLSVSPQGATVFTGGTQQYTAKATYSNSTTGDVSGSVQWSVTPASVATIGASGLLTAVAPGSFVVTAVSGGQTAIVPGAVSDAPLTSIAIGPAAASVNGGSTQQFTATGSYADQSVRDLTKLVVWTSSNPALLKVDAKGLGTAYGNNPATAVTLTAQLGAIAATASVEVLPGAAVTALYFKPSSVSLAAGTSQQQSAFAYYADGTQQDVTSLVTWSVVSGANAASVNAAGVVSAVAPGTAIVQAALGATQAQSTVIVNSASPVSLSISSAKSIFPVGSVQPLELIGFFPDGSQQDLSLSANWQSSDPAVATVSASGLATGVSAGAVQFSASFGGLKVSTIGFAVSAADLVSLAIRAPYSILPAGISEQLSVIGTYSDGSTQDLTSLVAWSSSDSTVFPVNGSGLAYALHAGSAQITAVFDGESAVVDVSSGNAVLQSIEIVPSTPKFALGTTLDFTANGYFSDGSVVTITDQALWSSADPSVLTIDGKGRARSGRVGATTVIVTLLGVSQSVPVSVSNATLAHLSISAALGQIAAGTSQQYSANGSFSDGSVQDLTPDVAWSVTDPTIASINGDGLVNGVKPGQVRVAAAFVDQSVSAPLTVSHANLLSVAVSPSNTELPVGVVRPFSLVGSFSDGTTEDLTTDAVWSAASPSIAAVTQKGVVTGVAAGSGSVSAQHGAFGASSTVNVTAAILTSIALTPAATTIHQGQQQQMVATGIFSDGFSQDLYLDAVFASSVPAVATIDQAGVALATGVGTTQMSASFRGKTATTASFRVTSNVLTAITISPASPSLNSGGTAQLTAIGTYADGTTGNVTGLVTWTSSNSAILSVDGDGLVTAHATSTTVSVTITAASGSTRASVTVTVSPAGTLPPRPAVTSLAIAPSSSRIAAGTTQQFAATATYSDGSTKDVSASVTWTSASPAIASVSSTGLASGVTPGMATIQARLGSGAGSLQAQATLIVSSATLVSVGISPTGASFAAGATQQFTLTGTFSDASTQNLSGAATWSSSAPAVVTISASGLATGAAAGNAQISASYGGQSASITVQITPASLVSIAITPQSASFAKGTTQQFHVIGTYSDGTAQDLTASSGFSSSNSSVVSIQSGGLATGAASGTAQITATLGSHSASTQSVTVTPAVLVSIAITPASSSFAQGTTQQFTATGTFSDGTTQDLTSQVAWLSSSPQVVTIDQNGKATGGGSGSVEISATLNGITATTGTVQVTAATLTSLILSPTTGQIAKGTTEQFSATGVFSDGTTQDLSSTVTWSSSNSAILTINAHGLATGSGVGSAQLTATYQGKSASTGSIGVTPATLVSIGFSPSSPSVAAGTSAQVTVTGTFSDGTTQDLSSSANYSSSSAAVTVNNSGVVTGVTPGSSTVTVQVDGVSSSFNVTVTNAVLSSISITPASPGPIQVGATQQFTATGTYSDGTTQNLSSSVTWTSSNPVVVSIDTHGLATGTGAGSASLSANYQGQSASTASFQVTAAPTLVSIAVSPTSSHVAAGTTQQFTAVGSYSDGTTQDLSASVTWTSTNPAAATVNSFGVATGIAAGTTGIQAQSGVVQGQATLVVSSATLVSVAISPSGASFAAGATQQFTLTGSFTDGSTQNLSVAATWTSLAPAVATVSPTGLATGVGTGIAQISAIYGGLSASTTVQITAATLVSIAITPSNASFAKGTTQQFHVVGTYSDGTTRDLTGSAAFSTSNAAVATISSSGVATGVGVGSVQFTATLGGTSATTQSVTVTPATLISIAVTPNAPSFANGTTQQFTATGNFSDGTTQDLSAQAVWTSSNTAVLTVNSSGLASSDGVGSAHISATLGGVTATTGTVQVTPAVLTNLAITPNTAQIAKGTTVQFTATGTFTDGTTQNLSTNVTWSSSNGAVVAIDATGLGTGTGTGSAQISASYQGHTASTASFQVTPATLVSIAFSPSSPSVAAGTNTQVTVTGTFSDGTTQNLSNSATYSSSNPSAVTVGSTGVITGVAPGSSTVTVQAGGLTGTFTVTVTNATLMSIAIAPANPANFAKGTTQQFTATGTYSDASTQDLTSLVTWSSTNSAVVTVDTHGLATGAGLGAAQISASYQSQTATTASFLVMPATVASITLSPLGASINVLSTQQFTATATYTDGTTLDVTATSVWSSSNPLVATVLLGLATGISSGSSTIGAQFGGASNSVSLTVSTPAPSPVTLQSIVVTPFAATVAKGNTQQFAATGIYSDGSTQNLTAVAAWQSSVPSVATVGSTGLATTIAGGNTQIWAGYLGVSGIATLTVSPATLVSLTVTPALASLADGTTQQYKATGTLSDGSTQDLTTSVTWSSSIPAAATINSSGFVSTHAVGVSTITAQAGLISGTAALTVTSASCVSVQLLPASVSLPAGGVQQLIATATFTDGSSQDVTASVLYSSSNPLVAAVNLNGLLFAVGPGSATITANLGLVSTTLQATVSNAVLSSIAITPASLNLAAGESQQLVATGTFTDGSTQDLTSSVIWSSSNSHVASVSATGDVIVAQSGNATIAATSGLVVATLSVTGTSAVITAISVGPPSTTLAAGQTQLFAATATMSDGTQQTITASAHWSVSDPTKGSISNSAGSNGLLTSIAAGTFTVSASSGSISGSASVTVQAAALSSLAITPNPVSVPAGATQALTVTGSYTDGSTANLNASASWSSLLPSFATVDASGVVHGVSPGVTTITAIVQGHSTTVLITTTNAVLNSISITPGAPSLALGLHTQLAATGHYTDGSAVDITSAVQWNSSAPAVATVSASGLISTLTSGTAEITATLGLISQQVPVTVTAAVLQSISIQASQSSFALGLSLQLTAVGTYSDSTTQNLTSSVTWSSQTPSVGVVSSTGLATGVTTGNFNAKATLNGVTGSLTITVTSGVLQSIVVTPANAIIVDLLGNQVQYTATGHFSDGSTQNLTSSVHWAITSGLAIGSISQSGLFSPLGVGLGTLSATSGSISGSTGFTVISAF